MLQKSCTRSFHVTCARTAGLEMRTVTINKPNSECDFKYLASCHYHSSAFKRFFSLWVSLFQFFKLAFTFWLLYRYAKNYTYVYFFSNSSSVLFVQTVVFREVSSGSDVAKMKRKMVRSIKMLTKFWFMFEIRRIKFLLV